MQTFFTDLIISQRQKKVEGELEICRRVQFCQIPWQLSMRDCDDVNAIAQCRTQLFSNSRYHFLMYSMKILIGNPCIINPLVGIKKVQWSHSSQADDSNGWIFAQMCETEIPLVFLAQISLGLSPKAVCNQTTSPDHSKRQILHFMDKRSIQWKMLVTFSLRGDSSKVEKQTPNLNLFSIFWHLLKTIFYGA